MQAYLDQILTRERSAIREFCQRFGVREFSVFGSILRDDFGPDSDVDVLLEFEPGRGFTFENTPEIQETLETIFDRPVDIVEKGRIRNPIRRRSIMATYRVLHAA